MDVLHLWQRTVCHISQISEGQKKALYRKWGLRVFHVVSWKREVDMCLCLHLCQCCWFRSINRSDVDLSLSSASLWEVQCRALLCSWYPKCSILGVLVRAWFSCPFFFVDVSSAKGRMYQTKSIILLGETLEFLKDASEIASHLSSDNLTPEQFFGSLICAHLLWEV